jgi:selenocysteine lyase/cysteine desulfurase
MIDPSAVHSSVPASESLLSRRALLAGSLAAPLLAAPGSQAQTASELPNAARELWQWVRTQPVLDTQVTYMDTAGCGPTWRAAMAAEYRVREQQSMELPTNMFNERWVSETQRLAERFAAFCGCSADEIVFTHGAGEGLGQVAAGLDLNSGDEVIIGNQEHPAALSPWLFLARRRGVVIKEVNLPAPLANPQEILDLFAAAITSRSRVLAFSHVQYGDGAVLPVRELCELARQKNLVSVVDGAQALGMLNLRLRELGCDFYATNCHKWLGGCQGTGLLFTRREMLDRLWPVVPRGIDSTPPVYVPADAVGHNDVPAALHKLGNIVPHLWPALRGSVAALEFHEQISRARIEARIRELSVYARLRLQPLGGLKFLTPARPGSWAGILTFRIVGRSANALAGALARNGRLHVRPLRWPQSDEGALRISLHIFNSPDDIDRLAQGLRPFTTR